LQIIADRINAQFLITGIVMEMREDPGEHRTVNPLLVVEIHLRDGRRVLAEVVGFQKDRLILLPLEHIEGISPGDAVTARTTPRYITLSDNILGRVIKLEGNVRNNLSFDRKELLVRRSQLKPNPTLLARKLQKDKKE